LGQPLVLVVIPLYNARPFIKAALDSILAQTYKNLKILVINDGSTDESVKVVEEYEDRGVLLWHQENQGPGAAMNRAIHYAHENDIEFIARIDADDISLPERIETQIHIMLANPAAAACSANCYYIDPITEKTIGTSTVSSSKVLICWEINHGLRGLIQPVVMFRTESLNIVGGYRSMFGLAEETDLFLRLAESFELINAKEFLAKIRINPHSLSIKNISKNIQYQFYALECAKKRKIGELEVDFGKFIKELSMGDRYRIWREEKMLKLWRQYLSTKNPVPLILSGLLDPRRVVVRILRRIIKES